MRHRRRREPRHAIYLAVTWPRWRHKFIKGGKQVLYIKYLFCWNGERVRIMKCRCFCILFILCKLVRWIAECLWREAGRDCVLVEGLNVITWRGVKPRTQWPCIITPANCLQRRVQIHKDLPQRQRRLQWRRHLRLQELYRQRVATRDITTIFISNNNNNNSSSSRSNNNG